MAEPRAIGSSSGSAEKFWAHELSYSSLASNDSGYTQQPWLPDDLAGQCMQCARPFHFLRWTHHCRDCGGVFCRSCTSHRVEAAASAASADGTTIRLCDNCAFSIKHPLHLGCDNPIACRRCAAPATGRQLGVYFNMLVKFLLCGACCSHETCWCGQPPRATNRRKGALSGGPCAQVPRLELRRIVRPAGSGARAATADQGGHQGGLGDGAPRRGCSAADRARAARLAAAEVADRAAGRRRPGRALSSDRAAVTRLLDVETSSMMRALISLVSHLWPPYI